MPRLDDLPADRRAVLQLLLEQGKTYDDLASLLRIAPETVRSRAHDALDRLGPASGEALHPDDREDISDYLLGQQPASERAATRRLLERSAGARAWARVVSGELRGLTRDGLPDIPAEQAEVEEAFDALEARKEARVRQARSSRLGGVLLLAAVGLAIAFFVIFVVADSGDDGDSASAGQQTTATTGTSTTSQVLGQVNLNAPQGSSSKALGAVTLVRQGDETGLILQGQDIPRNEPGDVYALWVTAPSGSARIGFVPRVGKNGRLQVSGPVPAGIDLSKYDTMVLSRETTRRPKTPGPVVLSGPLPDRLG